jgi:polyketide biosynthesis acyl carrier protein
MNPSEIFELIKEQINDVIPELSRQAITPNQSLKTLGANSIDRAEIIMLTMARLKVKIPLVQFAAAENIQSIINIFETALTNQLEPSG